MNIELKTKDIELKVKDVKNKDDFMKIFNEVFLLITKEQLKTNEPRTRIRGYNTTTVADETILSPELYANTLDDKGFQLNHAEKNVTYDGISIDEDDSLIDLSKYKFKQPIICYGFRCPKCLQGSVMKMKDTIGNEYLYYVYDVKSKTISLVKDEFKFKSDTFTKKEIAGLYDDLLCLEKDHVVELLRPAENITAICPCCGEEHPLDDWTLAFFKPWEYSKLDESNFCIVCGEVLDSVVNKEGYSHVCKNGCPQIEEWE